MTLKTLKEALRFVRSMRKRDFPPGKKYWKDREEVIIKDIKRMKKK